MLVFEIHGKGQKLGIIYCYGLAARSLSVQRPARQCLPRHTAIVSIASSTSILPLWSSALLFVPSTLWQVTSPCWEPIQSPWGNDLPTVGHPWWLVPFAGSPHVLLQDGKKGHTSPWPAVKGRIQQQQNIKLLQNSTRGDLILFPSSFATSGKSLLSFLKKLKRNEVIYWQFLKSLAVIKI